MRSLGRGKMTTFEFDEENGVFFFFGFFVVLVLGFMCVDEYGVVCSDREILMPWVSVSQLV